MPKMHFVPSSSGGGIFLATPSGTCPKPGYTYSLGQTMRDQRFEHALYVGDCHVDDARNTLVSRFLESNCTDLVFIDDDVSWKPEDLVKLCEYDRDVVAATYPLKQEDEDYPVAFLGGPIQADEDGLIEVAGVPTGFLRIRRHVLEKLANQSKWFENRSGWQVPLIFERQLHDGRRRGGDYTFCCKWRDLGGKIYLDPEMFMEHTGDHTWGGSWGHFKRNQLMGPIETALVEIAEKYETWRTYGDLMKAWGNPAFGGNDRLLAASVAVSRGSKHDILEFGSGLTTLVMAAANPNIKIHAVEHDLDWSLRVQSEAEKHGLTNIVMNVTPLEDGFYKDVPKGYFGAVLCDGPPHQLGDRKNVFEIADRAEVFIMDDVDCPVMSKAFVEWSDKQDRIQTISGRVGISRKRKDGD